MYICIYTCINAYMHRKKGKRPESAYRPPEHGRTASMRLVIIFPITKASYRWRDHHVHYREMHDSAR